jgi:hypothetical protein
MESGLGAGYNFTIGHTLIGCPGCADGTKDKEI